VQRHVRAAIDGRPRSSRYRRPYVPIREPNAANQREIAASVRDGFCVTTNYRVAEPLRQRYRAPLSVTE